MPLKDIGRSLTQEHAPIKGKETEIYIAVLEQGQQIAPVDQALFAVAFRSVVTLSGTPSNNDNYVLVLTTSGVPTTITYTATTAAGLTNDVVIKGLVALINASTAVAGYRAKQLTATTFVVTTATTTFTIANTGSTTPANITAGAVSGAAITKGLTTLTLAEPLTGQINPGQFLCFADKDDIERLVEVTAKADVGATSLTVRALDEAIAGGSQAEFPPYLWDRTEASVNRSYTDQTAVTFNTGGSPDGTPDQIEKSFSLPGLAYHYNAAYQTALKAADDQKFVYIRAVYPAPNSAFKNGGITQGRALVSSANGASPASGFRSADLEINMRGVVQEIFAEAVA